MPLRSRRCQEACTKNGRGIPLKHITLSKPEMAKDKPHNLCRHKNYKRCQGETSKSTLCSDDKSNGSLSKNNEVTRHSSEESAIDLHTIKAEPTNSSTSDMSMYDYKDEFDKKTRHTSEESANDSHTIKVEPSNYPTLDMSIYDHTDDFNQATRHTSEKSAIDSQTIKAEPSDSSTLDLYGYTGGFDETPDDKSSIDSVRKCPLCQITVKDQLELLQHQRESHKLLKTILSNEQIERYFDYPNRNNCPICKKPIRSNFRSKFIKHLKTHTMGKSAVCKICKMVFKSRSYMKNHEKRHVVQD